MKQVLIIDAPPLFSGYLKDKGSKKFKLRMWTADTYELSATTSIFSVKIDVNVK